MNHAPPVPKTFLASEDLLAFRYVKLGTAAETVDQCDAQGERAFGVAVHDVDVSEADGVSVWLLSDGGILLIEANVAITANDEVTASANGRCEPAASGDVILGRALEAASGAGHRIPVASDSAGRTHA